MTRTKAEERGIGREKINYFGFLSARVIKRSDVSINFHGVIFEPVAFAFPAIKRKLREFSELHFNAAVD